MKTRHHDEETDIFTDYSFYFEGVDVDFNDSWCLEATISLYQRAWWPKGERELMIATTNPPKVFHWTPHASHPWLLESGVEIEYSEDGDTRREVLATEKEADEIASRAVYDWLNVAHIAVTRTLSVGTGTVWFKVKRSRYFCSSLMCPDVRLVVEFGNSEECTRFLHEDMGKLKGRSIYGVKPNATFIDDIIRALFSIHDDLSTAENNAVRRGVPYSQFLDECSQAKTQLVRHRGSNRRHDRPCYLSLQIITNLFFISDVDCSAINNSPACPLRSDASRSLNNLHLKFPSHTCQDCNSSHQEDLTISLSAREISFLDGTNSVSAGNSFSIDSVHRTVTINYINNTGDAFLAPISGGNVGGRNNVNTFSMAPPPKSYSPMEHSRAQGLLLALARRRAQSRPKKAEQSTRGVGRSVKARKRRARPY